jgi:hypothetical protein
MAGHRLGRDEIGGADLESVPRQLAERDWTAIRLRRRAGALLRARRSLGGLGGLAPFGLGPFGFASEGFAAGAGLASGAVGVAPSWAAAGPA